MTYAENILSCFESGTTNEITEGMHWYDETHNFALSLSPDNVWRGAGVIAAMSANQKWEVTYRNTIRAFESGTAIGHTPSLHTREMCGQAERIMRGEHPLDVMGGQKVRAFASAIADPAGSDIATIDRHAHDIAMGRVFSDKERKIGRVLFRTMSNHYREAAFEVGISVAQIQAVTWVIWRNRKGVK